MAPEVRESALLLTLAIILAGVPIVLFHSHPIIFAHLIAEDFQGEYATAAAFAGAGLLFLVDAWRAPARSRRVFSVVLALAAIVFAGEEVSWGHRVWFRLLDFAKPEALVALNQQGELNLHNLEVVGLSERAYRLGSYLALAWLAVSALVLRIQPGLAARLTATGIPIVPLRLVPLCLLPVFFCLLQPVAGADEVAELLLGVATLVFALDRGLSAGWLAKGWLAARPRAIVLSLVAVGLIGFALAAVSPPRIMSWRLHTLATLGYPQFGMYEHAEAIFDHIDRYAAEFERPDTRLAHAEMLVAAGRIVEARTMLAAAVDQVHADPTVLGGDGLCRIGQLYAALGEQESAQAAFAAALVMDRRSLQTVADADGSAELMWSIARTLRAQGLAHEAHSMVTRAEQIAVSARLRRDLGRWLQELEAAGREPAIDVQALHPSAPPDGAQSRAARVGLRR